MSFLSNGFSANNHAHTATKEKWCRLDFCEPNNNDSRSRASQHITVFESPNRQNTQLKDIR